MSRLKKFGIGCLVFALVFAYMIINDPGRHITLKLGIFVGSNFDVHQGDSYAIIDEAIETFEQLHPNVSIEYESGIVKSDYSSWLSTKLLNGEQLDVFMVLNEDFNTLSSIDALLNLDDYMNNKNQYYDGILESGTYQGHVYALPYEASPMIMCVNKDLLEKENIDIPDENWTMEDFYNICTTVTKDNNDDGHIDQFGACNYDWVDSVNGYGVDLFDDNGNNCYLSDAKEALSFVQKLQDLNNGYQLTSDDFDKGNVAFCPMTVAQYRTYEPYPYRVSKYSAFSWYCLPMPGHGDNQKTVNCQTSLMSINSRSDYKDLSFEFIEILTSEDMQQNILEKSQGVPVLKNVINSDYTKTILQSGNEDVFSVELLDRILNNIKSEPKFKNYHRVMDKADYLITQSLLNNSIEIDIFSIENELVDELKQG